ncbi:MAG TPA: hypothetical protein VKZ53_04125 [Candidatus Angelobacter sp.]|nr:hypothetical protein [Candidatus Angelobacter sp.]
MKKFAMFALTMILGASLSFAQAAGSAPAQDASKTPAPAADTKTKKSGKKHAKKHAKKAAATSDAPKAQ